MYSLLRIIKFALQGFFRNFWLSLVTITIMLLAVLSVTILLGLDYIKQAAIDGVEQRIDILVPLDYEVKVEDVEFFVADLESLAEVKKTTIISPEENREMFITSNSDSQIREVLEIFAEDENPFAYSVAIQAYNLDQYRVIAEFIDQEKYTDLVENKFFHDHQSLISTINNLANNLNKYSWYIIGIFLLISVIVIFNTIRISIYSRKEQIGIMKLVGASNWFIRAPFLLEGVFYSLATVVLLMVVVYLASNFIQPSLNAYFEGNSVIDIAGHFQSNGLIIFGLQFVILAILNIVSTTIAISKYLKV